ncbi:hypothetical protein [Nocardia yunnanensis]|uniref:hypothetical protein n=1 Tax=Nocardia yunnanensis TaxID=2382165 RepID=UPI001FEC2AFA|nr:hypothetical protein [Nocardia yunnanensis]
MTAASENVGGKPYFVADAEKTNVWRFLGEVAADLGYPRPTRTLDPRLVAAVVAVVENLRRVPYLAEHWTPPLSRYSVAVMTRTGTYDTSAATRDFDYHPVMDRDTGMTALKSWLRTGEVSARTAR